jgi:RNA chaperone Hfq
LLGDYWNFGLTCQGDGMGFLHPVLPTRCARWTAHPEGTLEMHLNPELTTMPKTRAPRDTSAQPDLQAICLQRLLEAEAEVFIFLLSGIRMQGFIGGFDIHTVLLQQPGSGQQLLYKQGIASIVPKANR